MSEILKTENLWLHGELFANWTAHARALMDDIRLRRGRKKAVEEKEEVALLLAAEKAKQGDSAVDEQLKKDAFTVTVKTGDPASVVAASVKHAVKEVGKLNEDREAAILASSKL